MTRALPQLGAEALNARRSKQGARGLPRAPWRDPPCTTRRATLTAAVQGDEPRPLFMSGSTAAGAAVDLLADQRAGSGAEDRAKRAIAATIDLAAEQGTGGAADDQAGSAVLLAAIGAAIVTAPDAGVAIDRLAIRAAAVVTAVVPIPMTVAITIAAVAVPAVVGRGRAISRSVEIDRRSRRGDDGHARSSEGQGCFCNEAFHGLGSYQSSSDGSGLRRDS